MKLPAYEALAQAFVAEGVDTLYTLMGDANMHWANAMAKRNGVRVIHMRHEHCACTAAISYAWATGRPGVASVTCGPGFTQTMTALATAVRGHAPIVVVAGEASLSARYHNQRIAQAPLAEAAGARYIEAHSLNRMMTNVREAFHCAQIEKAPVVLGIPHDLQMQLIDDASDYQPSASLLPSSEGIRPNARLVADVARRIRTARRPVIIAGRGAVASDVKGQIEELAAQCGALLATTLPAKGLFDGHEFSIGIAGGFASELAYELFADSDLVISVGASLSNHTAHGGRLYPKAFVVQIDLDPGWLPYGVGAADLSLKCDAEAGLEAILDQLRQDGAPTPGFHSAALARRIATEKHDPREYPIEPGTFDPREVIAELDRVIPKDWDVVTGAGHSSYFTSLMRGRSPKRYFSLREFGAVGNGLSYAVGVAAVRPEGKVLLLEGDGGLLMHIQELETIKRHKLKLVIGIMNDGGYGAEVHKFRADGLDPAEAIFGRPDFAAIAKGFGLRSANIMRLDQFSSLLRGYEAAGGAEVWDIPISDRVPSLYQLRAAQARH
jgi:thiamine pyrophosphate-dependent acetolactate synthase large subunit-like protein